MRSFRRLLNYSKMALGTFDRQQFLELSSWLSKVNQLGPDVHTAHALSVELHEEIRAVVPLLVDMLNDGDEDVRSAAVSGIAKLAEHGEFH